MQAGHVMLCITAWPLLIFFAYWRVPMVHDQHHDAVCTSADVNKTQSGQAALYYMHAMAAFVNASDSISAVGTRQLQDT
jgi:hypothetical protein